MIYNKFATNYKTLGKRESRLVTELMRIKKTVFTASDARNILLLGGDSVKQILFSLKRKRWILQLGRGMYELNVEGGEKKDVLEIAAQLVWPSYLSLWSALNFYGLTEQVPRTLFFITTKRPKTIILLGAECVFHNISKDRFFGYQRTGSLNIAEKEKAVIDSLYFLDKLPFEEVEKAFRFKEFDIGKLVNYGFRMRSKALLKRLGYLMEKHRLLDKSSKYLLLKGIGKGFSLLDPRGPKEGKYNKGWMLIINR